MNGTIEKRQTKNSGRSEEAAVERLVICPTENKFPNFEQIQGAIAIAMRDLCKNADDTVWITDFETMLERLMTLFLLAGGTQEQLDKIGIELEAYS